MPKSRKFGADAVQEAAIGHNSPKNDALIKEHVEKIAKWQNSIDGIRGHIKEELQAAKDEGFLKTAMRNAVKNLRMSEEQKQARQEIDDETRRITELCHDLPLFGGTGEQREAA